MTDAALHIVPETAVKETIDSFTELDEAGDKRTLTRLARRLGREQPALLQRAAAMTPEHGEALSQGAVFYGCLVWGMFERHYARKVPRLLPKNLEDAEAVLQEEWSTVEGLDEKPIHERIPPGLAERQPHVVARLQELIEEDVREEALEADAAVLIFRHSLITAEAFDAAITGRRPGQALAPVTRATPKVGRNEPCPCGSGKKYKRCHGV